MIDAFTAVCGYKHPTCDAKNVFGFCVFLRRQSKSEEAALSSLSRLLFILANLLGNKRSSFVICDWWISIRFVCFCVSRLDTLFLKSTVSFTLALRFFFIFFTLKNPNPNPEETQTTQLRRVKTNRYVPVRSR